MKTKILFLSLFLFSIFAASNANAQKEEMRNVPVFSEISLKLSATLHFKQSEKQSVRIVAKESTLEDIISEVKGNKLIFRLPSKKLFQRNYNPGKVDIYVSAPEIDGLAVSGSGDIIAKSLDARIISLAISGSGDIKIDNLDSKKVKNSISGSGTIKISGNAVADELSVAISGSGDFYGENFEAESVKLSVAGSGDCRVKSNGKIKASVAGSGDVYYKGNPSIESSVAGSGKVRKM